MYDFRHGMSRLYRPIIRSNLESALDCLFSCRWLHPGSSNMAVLEVSLPSGFVARSESIESLIGSGLIKRSEVEGRVVLLYFDDVISSFVQIETRRRSTSPEL